MRTELCKRKFMATIKCAKRVLCHCDRRLQQLCKVAHSIACHSCAAADNDQGAFRARQCGGGFVYCISVNIRCDMSCSGYDSVRNFSILLHIVEWQFQVYGSCPVMPNLVYCRDKLSGNFCRLIDLSRPLHQAAGGFKLIRNLVQDSKSLTDQMRAALANQA